MNEVRIIDINMHPDDVKFMKRAISLARKGHTAPNPMVGAVIVKDGKIAGEGYHPKAGEPHAEIFAINRAGNNTLGADLYVTLEPCSHFGKTPPCTDAIINAGIKQVFASMIDPNPKVSGKGIEKLRSSGIIVNVGILEEKAKELNKGFIKRITTGMPYVFWKAAMSIDGKIAANSGNSKWITGKESRREVQKIRNSCDAIITGAGTIKADNPEMTVHDIINPHNPIRIVVDSMASISTNSRILDNQSETIIAVTNKAPAERIKSLELKCNVIILPSDINGQVDLVILMKRLGEIGINNIMLESGGELAASMINSGLVDSGVVFIAPKIIGGRDAKTIAEGAGISLVSDAKTGVFTKTKRFGSDIALYFDLHNKPLD